MAEITPSQTIGPFFERGMAFADSHRLLSSSASASASASASRVRVRGALTDGTGGPVPDGLLEIWQATPQGHYVHPADQSEPSAELRFAGFGRVQTDDGGEFEFETLVPGAVPHPAGSLQAPHLLVGVFARGLLRRFVTRMYFPDEPANESDPVLLLVPEARRATLIARPVAPGELSWDLALQGEHETVFFDV